MNVAFIGYRCSGKSTLSRGLQQMIGWQRVEIDLEIEKHFQASIPDIINIHGWKKFRRQERLLIQKYSRMDNIIVDLGGGAVLDPQNMKNIKKKGLVIYLDCSERVVLERLKKSFYRPPLTTLTLEEETRQTLERRTPFYKKLSDYSIHSDQLTIDQAVNLAIFFIREYKLGCFCKEQFYNNHFTLAHV